MTMSPKVRALSGLLVVAAIISVQPYASVLGAIIVAVVVFVAIWARWTKPNEASSADTNSST